MPEDFWGLNWNGEERESENVWREDFIQIGREYESSHFNCPLRYFHFDFTLTKTHEIHYSQP